MIYIARWNRLVRGKIIPIGAGVPPIGTRVSPPERREPVVTIVTIGTEGEEEYKLFHLAQK